MSEDLYYGENEEIDDGDEEAGQEVERLAVFDVEDGEAGGNDEDAADNLHLAEEGVGDDVAAQAGNKPNASLPTEEDGGCQDHSDAVGGCKYGGGDEVERGVGVEVGVVAKQGAVDGTYDGERADAIKQDAGGESLGKGVFFTLIFGDFINESLESPVEVEHSADESANAQTENEEDGILAVGHIVTNGIESECQRCQTHGCEQNALPLRAYAFLDDGSND